MQIVGRFIEYTPRDFVGDWREVTKEVIELRRKATEQEQYMRLVLENDDLLSAKCLRPFDQHEYNLKSYKLAALADQAVIRYRSRCGSLWEYTVKDRWVTQLEPPRIIEWAK